MDSQTERNSSQVADALTLDHARLSRLLAEVAASFDDGEQERAEHTFEEFASSLRRHIAVEEELVFPSLESHSSWASRPAVVMRAEHRRIEELIAQVGAAISRSTSELFHRAHHELVALLAAHDAKEERVLYPACDEALTPSERATLAYRLDSPRRVR